MIQNENHKEVVLILELANNWYHTRRRIATMAMVAFVAVAVVMGRSTSRAEEILSQHDRQGFRQGIHPGVAAEGRYPTIFDVESDSNLEWKAATTGLGHSSPVISGNHVFVTAAFSSSKTQTTKRYLGRMATVSQILFAILSGVYVASDVLAVCRGAQGRIFHAGRSFFTCFMGITSLSLLQLGADVFDYQRCPIRSWLGSHLAISLGIAIALSQTMNLRWLRWINFTLLVIMGLSTLFCVPAKDHAYRHAGPQSFVVVGVSIVPVTLAIMISFFHARSFRPDGVTGRHRDGRLITLAIVMLILGFCGFEAAFGTNVDYLNSIDVNHDFFPVKIATTALVSSAIGLAVSMACYGILRFKGRLSDNDALRRKERLAALCLVAANGAACMLLLATVAIFLDFLIPRSSFLRYHLPAPGWQQFEYRPLLSLAGAFALAALVTIAVTRRIQTVPTATAAEWECEAPAEPLSRCVSLLRGSAGASPSQGESSRRVKRPTVSTTKWTFPGTFVTAVVIVTGALHIALANGTHNEQQLIRAVMAFDRQDGSIKWTWQGFASPAEVVHRENSQATPTPCVVGQRVVAYFGSTGMVCLDSRSGKQLWSRTDLPYKSAYGAAASPVIASRYVIIVSDAPTAARITAVELDTGRTGWEHDRTHLIGDEDVVSGHSNTPLVVDIEGRSVVTVWGWNKLITYESETGNILSEIELIGGGDHVASAAGNQSFIYFGNPRELIAIRKSSLISNSIEIPWRTKANSNCVSARRDGRKRLHLFGSWHRMLC